MLQKRVRGEAHLLNHNGFTLVEILVVLAVLAMLIPIVLLVVAHTINLNNEARLQSSATLLAESLAEQLRADVASLPASGAQPPYSWRWQSKTGAGVPESLEEIDIQVSWEYRGKPSEVRLATYRQVTP